jgi:hypothetical protein
MNTPFGKSNELIAGAKQCGAAIPHPCNEWGSLSQEVELSRHISDGQQGPNSKSPDINSD